MSASYFKSAEKFNRFLAAIIIVSILFTFLPAGVFAEDTVPPIEPPATTEVDGTASSTDSGTEDTSETQASSTPETATSTDDGGTASSTESGTDGGDGNNQDGEDGEAGAQNGDTASSTATTTPSQGDSGTPGDSGTDGNDATAGATPDDDVTPVEIISDGLLGDDDAPEAEETTGDIRTTATHALIETGLATAQGELSTDANSNDVRSELGGELPNDFDFYTFVATGTNEAIVSNDGLARSTSGDNYARGRSTSEINTGDSISAFNVANVINTNVINSDGFIYLANKILEEGQSLDLTTAFFPDVATERELAETCSLLSCIAEDVVYNVSQLNHATITNNVLVESVTGYNEATGDLSAEIKTGDAYAAANVMNVVNSNIIDSNYRLFTYNAIGDLDGDLVLPSQELFDAFFGRANGLAADENDRRGKYENFNVNANNFNEAIVDNAIDAYAETGLNDSTTDFASSIVTGRGESESNVLNKINENTYGGDSMYLLIRVHGIWYGDVVGLPEGLSWEWTPLGIVIYNTDAEVTPSEFLSSYDLDSYTANFDNNNRVALENNITVNAITGENEIDALVGSIETGNAFASANVMNIANTNIIGTNWTFAVINILGDFEGNVSFEATDLTLAGTVSSNTNPLTPGDTVNYSYTVTNNGDKTSTGVTLEQFLESAKTASNQSSQTANLGQILPGASKSANFTAIVNNDIPYGTVPVVAYAQVSSDQGDENAQDNLLMLSINASNPDLTDSGTTTDDDNATTTDDNNATSTDDTTATTTDDTTATTTDDTPEETPVIPPVTVKKSGGGGGGGSGNISRNQEKYAGLDPKITIKKEAKVEGKIRTVKAGETVDYKITVTNNGGAAYDAIVYDVLRNPIEAIMDQQSWDLGDILPGEKIELTYSIDYNPNTPSGSYVNTASIVVYEEDNGKSLGLVPLPVKDAVNEIKITGVDLAIGNVGVINFIPNGPGKSTAVLAWETSKFANGQIFYGPHSSTSPYNKDIYNLGYQNASVKFPGNSVSHYVMLPGLENGKSYLYRIRVRSGDGVIDSREYILRVPLSGMVAGASTTDTVELLRQTLITLIGFLRARIESQVTQAGQ